jgi:hypothetical protein
LLRNRWPACARPPFAASSAPAIWKCCSSLRLAMPDARSPCTPSARGFRDIWHAVLEAFATQHAVGHVDVTINDMGATPAVVTLRLEQALAAFAEGTP